MPVDLKRLQAVFLKVVEVEETAARLALLEQECGGDAELSERVKALLKAHAAADAPLFPSVAPMEDRDDRTWTAIPEAVTGVMIAGRYKLLEPIGEGGMGLVWMAEQRTPVRRLIALKLIKAGMDSRAVIARFEAERQALAMMDHPCIARVLDGGTTERGYPWFAMELVRGLPLTEYCDQRRMSVAERLELFIQICSAVQHAHQKGIIHRDLKPSNVLVTEHDGRPLPKVIDFGLAKALGGGPTLTDQTLHTSFGAAMGTLLYMAPEQVAINALDVDTRADIYALGVILYELLSGSTPVERQRVKDVAWEEIRRVIREEEPPRPSMRVSRSDTLRALAVTRDTEPARLSGLIKGDLDWIVLKALEKDRNRRYETANGLAADVRRHLLDEPVLAAPPSLNYRIHKLLRRHKEPILAATGVFLVLVLGIVGTTLGLIGETRARALAEAARIQADSARAQAEAAQAEAVSAQAKEAEQTRLARRQLADGLVSQGDALRLVGRAPKAQDRFLQARSLYQELGLPLLPADLGLLSLAIENPPELMAYAGHTSPLWSVAFSSDGRTALSGSLNGTLKRWDVVTGNELQTYTVPSFGLLHIAFSPDGRMAIAESDQNNHMVTTLWDLSSGKELRTFSGSGAFGGMESVVFSPDGHAMLSVNGADILTLWDIDSGKEIRTFSGRAGFVQCLTFSHDGRLALSGTNDGTLKLWDIATGTQTRSFIGHTGLVHCVAFSPDGRTALSGSQDKTLKLWDVATGKELHTFSGHTDAVDGVAFSPDGRRALSGSNDRSLKLWDIAGGKEVRTFSGRGGSVLSVAFSSDGRTALSGSDDGTLKLWDIAADKELRTFWGHAGGVIGVAFSPDGRMALSGGHQDKALKLWDIATGKELRTFAGPGGFVLSTSISPDGRMALSSSDDDTLKLWDLGTGKQLRVFAGHTDFVTSVAFSPDGRTALSGSYDSTLKLWDISTGRELRTFSGHSTIVWSVAFSPDGHTALSGCGDGTLKLWDVATGKELRTFSKHAGFVQSVVFSPDGRTALSGSLDKTLKLWDIATGKELHTFSGHSEGVECVAFSPDGRFALSGSKDKTSKLWDITTDEELRTFLGHSGTVFSVAFSPDSRSVLSGSEDGTLKLWDSSRADTYCDIEPKVKAAQKSLQANPQDSSALAAMGGWYAFRGMDDWAIDFLERARRWRSKHFAADGRPLRLEPQPIRRCQEGVCCRAGSFDQCS